MHAFLLIVILIILSGFSFAQSPLLARSRQAIVVTTDGWDAVSGRAQLFERKKPRSKKWKAVGEAFPIVVGKNGLAYANGSISKGNIPVKHEGDGRSPAGIFSLTTIFGWDAAKQTSLPFTQLTPATECVDDSKSIFYNQIVDDKKVAVDWDSSEKMLKIGPQYELGVFVAHNTPASPQQGSCIFLHIWKGDGSGTSGCTAMEKSNLETVVEKLDVKKEPVLIQLPQSEYQLYRKSWKLPKLK
jgi:D-alanyl-D-alanine dipeptidase